MSSAAIQFEALTKDYRDGWWGRRVRALDGFSWTVPAGSIAGLLGANGCGKSTTLKLLLGLIHPTAGRCRVGSGDPHHPTTRRRIGYLPQGAAVQGFLTGREVVQLHARLAGVERRGRAEQVDRVLDWVGLSAMAARRCRAYSTGMRRRLGLAQALVHDPDLLVLDEPMAGVDAHGVEELVDLLQRLRAAGKTILLTSHLLPQMEELCDHVALLHAGRLVVAGEIDRVTGQTGRRALIVDPLPEMELRALETWLAERGSRLHRVESASARLDQVVLERTRARGEGDP